MRRVAVGLAVVMLATVLVVAGGTRPAYACSCGPPTDQQAFHESDAVFVGRVVSRTIDTQPRGDSLAVPAITTFSVTKVFKGKVAKRQEVVDEYNGCGLEVVDGAEYFVFGWLDSALFPPDPQPAPGQLSAWLCNGTRSTDKGPLDVKGLRGKPPRARPADSVVVSGLVTIDGARLGNSTNEVVLDFVGAPKVPRSDPCWEGYSARVREDDSGAVPITIRRLHNAEPPDEPIGCTAIGAFRTIRITLNEPLGDRPVYDGVDGSYFREVT